MVKLIKINYDELFKRLDEIVKLDSYYQRTNLYEKLKLEVKSYE